MARVILITGSNGCGKTTLLSRVAPRPGLRAIHADGRPGTREQDHLFKTDKPTAVRSFVRALATSERLMVEGTNRAARALFDARLEVGPCEEFQVFVLIQSAAVMESRLRARSAAQGKAYNERYWDKTKLEYEGMRRYPTLVRTYAPPEAKIQIINVDTNFSALDPVLEYLQQW